MKNLNLIAVCFVLLSCKKGIVESPNNTNDDNLIIKSVNALPNINSTNIVQLPVKNIEYTLSFAGTDKVSKFNQEYTYYTDGRIKAFGNEASVPNFLYLNNELQVNSNAFWGTYILDSDGLASINSGYFFKNRFLIRDRGALKRTYSKDGNMISYIDGTVNITYEYTDFPNNIRQEVTQTVTPHLSNRDLFLGNFSTNLIKKARFDESGYKAELNFTYEFDAQNRVNKVIINRLQFDVKSTITYIYNY